MATKVSEMTGAAPEYVYDDPPAPDPDPLEIVGPDPTPEEIEAAREEIAVPRTDPENLSFEAEAEAIRLQMEKEQAVWVKENTEQFNADVAKIEADRADKEKMDADERAAALRAAGWSTDSKTLEGAVEDAAAAVKSAILSVSKDATEEQAEVGARMVADDVQTTLEAAVAMAEPSPAVLPIRNVHENEVGGLDCEVEHPKYGWVPYTVPNEPADGAEKQLAEIIRQMHGVAEPGTK